MFDIRININNIDISSIEKEDIITIQRWINCQNYNFKDNANPLGLKEIHEKFLEYYVSESEFFLKINKDSKLIGVLKGRIEFKNPNEVWFWYFLLDSAYRGRGIGSEIIKGVKDYFSNNLGIYNFYTGVSQQDREILKFWNKNKFELVRVSKKFFNVNGEEIDMFVLKKEG